MIFPSARLLRQAAATITRQNNEIYRLRDEVRAAELQYMRIARDMLEQFLIVLDLPEEQDEIRERMTTSLGFYRDEIAVREEHV